MVKTNAICDFCISKQLISHNKQVGIQVALAAILVLGGLFLALDSHRIFASHSLCHMKAAGLAVGYGCIFLGILLILGTLGCSQKEQTSGKTTGSEDGKNRSGEEEFPFRGVYEVQHCLQLSYPSISHLWSSCLDGQVLVEQRAHYQKMTFEFKRILGCVHALSKGLRTGDEHLEHFASEYANFYERYKNQDGSLKEPYLGPAWRGVTPFLDSFASELAFLIGMHHTVCPNFLKTNAPGMRNLREKWKSAELRQQVQNGKNALLRDLE